MFFEKSNFILITVWDNLITIEKQVLAIQTQFQKRCKQLLIRVWVRPELGWFESSFLRTKCDVLTQSSKESFHQDNTLLILIVFIKEYINYHFKFSVTPHNITS